MHASDLYIESTGSGHDLVLLHGWGLHGGLWRSISQTLARDYTVHAIDLPGHGRSPLSDRPFTLEHVAEAVAEAVPAGATWIGWSLGGVVTLAAALNGADIDRLVLVGAGPRFIQGDDWPGAVAPEVLTSFSEQLASDYKSTLLRFLALQSRGSERGREELRTLRSELFAHGEPAREALEGGLAILQQTDLRLRLSEIEQPCLLIHGEKDTLFSLATAEATARVLPCGQLVTIQGAGHAPFLSHPVTFASVLKDFLQ